LNFFFLETIIEIENKKHNKHHRNTDEGGEAMGEDINMTQMMVGKKWVKN